MAGLTAVLAMCGPPALAAPANTGATAAEAYTYFGATDWDRDGHQDLIARDNTSGDLWLYPGQSRRGPSSAARVRIGSMWHGYTFYGATDWNRDGHQDLLARQDSNGDLWLYLGQSRPAPGAMTGVRIGSGWNGYTSFGTTDWNKDGHQDLLARQDNNGDLWLYLGQSQPAPGAMTGVRIGSGWNGYTSFGTTDWDRDGHQDVIARQDNNGDLWLYLGQSRPAPGAMTGVRIGNGWNDYTSFGTTDWDRDGHQDVLARHDPTRDLWLYPGESRRGPSTTERVKIGNGW